MRYQEDASNAMAADRMMAMVEKMVEDPTAVTVLVSAVDPLRVDVEAYVPERVSGSDATQRWLESIVLRVLLAAALKITQESMGKAGSHVGTFIDAAGLLVARWGEAGR